LPCFAWKALFGTLLGILWFRFVWPRCTYYFALPCSFIFAHLAWLVAGLICFPCRNWCKIVIEANLKSSRNAHITPGRPVSPADSKSSRNLQHLRMSIRKAALPIQRK
jgi:hypothetical protein